MEQVWNKAWKVTEKRKNLYELFKTSFQGVKRLFALAYVIAAPSAGGNSDNTAVITSNKNYFIARGEIENYNVLFDGRNCYDQPINDITKQHDEVRKASMGYSDDLQH